MRVPAAIFVGALVLAFVGSVGAAEATTRDSWPTTATTPRRHPSSFITREGSAAVALRARFEGYQWAGGCWNDDDRDNSPGDPTEDPSTGGEGPDCSGFTFKVWRESESTSNGGFYQWGMFRDVHGPYTAASFKSGIGAPNSTVAKSAAIKMDAFASQSHIGLVYAKNADGTDQIIEAKGEAYGTGIWTRTYRGDSSYTGVRRIGWSS